MIQQIYFGIDPGRQGALALLLPTAYDDGPTADSYAQTYSQFLDETISINNVFCVGFMDWPKTNDFGHIASRLNLFFDAIHIQVAGAWLEDQHAIKGDTPTTAFGLGHNFGQWEGMLAANLIPLHYVTPVVWKRSMRLINKEKAEALVQCSKIFPGVSPLLYGIRGGAKTGRADALLIAYYGMRSQAMDSAEAREKGTKSEKSRHNREKRKRASD